MHVNSFLIPFTKFNLTGDLSSIFRVFLYHHSMNKIQPIKWKKKIFGQTKKLIQFWEMVSNYNVNSSYTYKKLKKCKNKWILCQKSKIYNKTFKILSIGKVFIKSTNSKMIFFISKIPLKLLDWFRIWKTCVNHTLAHREIFNKNCDSSIPQNKTKISTIIE